LSNVRSLDAVAWSGGHALVSVTRDPTGSREVWRLAASAGAPTLVFSLRSNTQVDRIASRGDGVVAYAVSTGAGTWLVRTDLTTGASDVFLPVPLPLGPSLGFSPTGHLGFSIGSTGAPALHFAWSDGGSAVLIELPVVAGFLLPAR
jgi:hypothetical protein